MAARTALGIVATVALATIAFGAVAAPREAVGWWLGLFALSALALAVAARSLIRSSLELAARERLALIGAALIGVACLAPPVSLSDDIARYAWDGHVTASGANPFASRPSEIVGRDATLSDAALGRLNSPDYYSVYPPLAQLAFAAAALVERGVGLRAERALRVLFLAGGLLAAHALFGLARRHAIPLGWALAFVWNPLLWWELVAGGHTEGLMLAPLLYAVGAATLPRAAHAGRAGVWLGLAASAKLTALLFAPALAVYLFRRRGWHAVWLGLSLVVLGLGFAPFAAPGLFAHVQESLALFTGRFSFNAPIYYALRDAMGYVAGLTPSMDAQLVPAMQAGGVAWVLGAAALQDGRDERLFGGLAYGYLGYLLLSRVIHPWYVLPALALGALGRSRAVVALSVAVPLSYLSYAWGREAPAVLALEWAPFFAIAALELARTRRRYR